MNNKRNLLSPAFVYNQISAGCSRGSNFKDAFEILINQGVATMEDFPYSDKKCISPSSAVKKSASQFRIHSYRRLGSRNIVDEIKYHLNIEVPIIVGMMVVKNFGGIEKRQVYNRKDFRQGINDGEEPGGHAMVIVGYDDRKQAFKLINSWSTKWGEKGFGWVSYNLLKSTTANGKNFEAYVMVDEINENSPQEWNWVNKPGYSRETQWVDKTRERSKGSFGRENSGEESEEYNDNFDAGSGKPDIW